MTPARCAREVSAPAAPTSQDAPPGPHLTVPLPPESSHPALLERKVFGVEGGSAFLECEPRSLQARVEWTFQSMGEATGTQVSLPPLRAGPPAGLRRGSRPAHLRSTSWGGPSHLPGLLTPPREGASRSGPLPARHSGGPPPPPRPLTPSLAGPGLPQVPADKRAERTERGLLLRGLRRGDAGAYLCAAVEQGFSQPLRRLALHVLSAAQAERLARAEEAAPAAPPGPKLWYRDFLQLVEPGGGGTSSLRMCRPQPAPRPPPAPLRKGRQRRTRAPELRAERGPRSAAHW